MNTANILSDNVKRVNGITLSVKDNTPGEASVVGNTVVGVAPANPMTSPVAASYGSNLQVAGTAVFRHPEGMKKAVELCKGKAETECSGNVTKENVAKLTRIGVNYISSGALTHSSPILDLSLKNLHAV